MSKMVSKLFFSHLEYHERMPVNCKQLLIVDVNQFSTLKTVGSKQIIPGKGSCRPCLLRDWSTNYSYLLLSP